MSSEGGEGTAARRGLLFIVSAPSGTGKTTLVARLVEILPDLARSRSYTSRPARAGETDGVDYNFITRDRFEAMIDVFGNLYGTRAADTERLLASGRDVVLVIDVQGARQVRSRAGLATVAIFVLPPSYEVLERRLRGRSQDSEPAMRRRLETARHEIGAFAEYDYVVVNDELNHAVDRLRGIVVAERARLSSMEGAIRPIVESFGN
jgi:guanylate kinase